MRLGYKEGELEGDWAVFARIAGPFVNRVPFEDREDFLQDMLLEMGKVKAKYEAIGKPLREAGLMWVASYELKAYWAKRRYRLFGLNCSRCSSEQRRECYTTKEPSECPKGKARQVLRLNKILRGDDGDGTELQELIPDDKTPDLDARLDAIQTLKGLPKGLTRIAYKKCAGYPLNKSERTCINPDHFGLRRGLLRTLGQPTHCKQGHPFDKANTRVDARGHRTCRICHRESTGRYAAKHLDYYAGKRRQYYWDDIDVNRANAREYQRERASRLKQSANSTCSR